eukprot:4581430-Ditylum_brightwellii.AAC.1
MQAKHKSVKGKGDTHKDTEVTGQDIFWPLCSDTKSPPLCWLNYLLTNIAPDHNNKYTCMDLGSDLGRNEEVRKLLMKHGYDIRPTAPDASHQNTSTEWPHGMIGDAITYTGFPDCILPLMLHVVANLN